jgi:hypothetical protein
VERTEDGGVKTSTVWVVLATTYGLCAVVNVVAGDVLGVVVCTVGACVSATFAKQLDGAGR